MYHLTLCKGLSYYSADGKLKATRQQPDAYTEDKATADAAVASGFFVLAGEDDNFPPPGEVSASLFDAEELTAMSDKALNAFAKEKEIDLTNCESREDILEAISVALGGSCTMLDLMRE